MTPEELKTAFAEGKARNAADPHGLAYAPPIMLKDGAARCNCGWMSKTSTPGRAFAAWERHRKARTENA